MRSDEFAERLAAPTPTPGGGAAAARVGSFAAALARMAAGITLRRAPEGEREPLEAASAEAEKILRAFQKLEEEDAEAFEGYLRAQRAPGAGPEAEGRRAEAVREALERATAAPLAMIERSLDVLRLVERILELEPRVKIRARADLFAAVELAEATVRIASANALENVSGLGAAARGAQGRLADLIRSFDELRDRLTARLRAPRPGAG
ncbi:MAG: cyclodeaminase/cyclohydrolase family protein [Planctomycetota bacterium]